MASELYKYKAELSIIGIDEGEKKEIAIRTDFSGFHIFNGEKHGEATDIKPFIEYDPNSSDFEVMLRNSVESPKESKFSPDYFFWDSTNFNGPAGELTNHFNNRVILKHEDEDYSECTYDSSSNNAESIMKTLKTEDDIDIDYEDVKPKICEESGENKSVSNSVADSSIGTKIGQNKLLSNEDPFKNNDFTSPEIKVQAQIDTHCTTKIHMTRLRSTKRHLFEEEEFINEHKIPDTASEDNFVQVPGKVCDKKLVKLSDAYANYTEASTSRTKTVEKSFNDFGVYKENGEIRKGKKKTDFCFYCKTSVLNFARHITRNHSCEFDVQKIMSKPSGSIERRLLLDLLRNKGNFLNNNVVCKPVQSLRSARDLLPCDNCLGFFSKKLLWRHRNKCNDSMNRNHQGAAQNILLGNLSIDAHLKNTVFPSMRADEISLIAKKDPLICAYGARYIKVHREKHFINVASRKMREIARLLMELKKMEPTIKCLFDALKPKYFDTIVMATKAVSKYNVEKDKFDSPTYALNMGTYLKQCTEIAIEFALKRKQIAETVPSAEAEGDLKTLIKVIESQWQYEISSQAASDLNMSKWNKK